MRMKILTNSLSNKNGSNVTVQNAVMLTGTTCRQKHQKRHMQAPTANKTQKTQLNG